MRLPHEEELEFGSTVRELLQRSGAVATTRNHADTGEFNRELWAELTDLGATELVTDREWGALAQVFEALGAYPATVPMLASAVIVPALIQAIASVQRGSEDAEDAALNSLTGISSIGPFTAQGRLSVSELSFADDGSVTGKVPLALQATWAEQLVTTVRSGNGEVSVVSIPLDHAGVSVTPRASLDVTQPLADVDIASVSVEKLATFDESALQGVFDSTERVTAFTLSAGEVGTAARLLDMAVEYSKQRVQFGMTIASRQAIKHKCADMLISVESARSALWATLDLDPTDAEATGPLALLRLASGRAAEHTAQQSFQIHGGIGFTWEHDLHFLFKRAAASRGMLGGSAQQHATLTKQLLEK